jgi:predicted tellurium resistance membrane protein TerC
MKTLFEGFAKRIFTGPFLVTIIRYGLVAAGTWLVANGYLTEATWQTILTALLTIVVALLGGVESTKDKAVFGGKSVAAEHLPVEAQKQIKQATAVKAKRRNIFDMFVGK